MENLDFIFEYKIPNLTTEDKKFYFDQAEISERNRSPYIIHKRGDEFNQVFNFILEDSYMKPHMHPKSGMSEKMHLIEGSFKLIFFNNNGEPIEIFNIEKPGQRIQVPAFTWHTYIMTSKSAIIFETMMGVYDPKTWKKPPDWAPDENSNAADEYFRNLKNIK
jgi:cupin fold WbuC family metalloprotein